MELEVVAKQLMDEHKLNHEEAYQPQRIKDSVSESLLSRSLSLSP